MTTQDLIDLIAEAWLEVGAPVTVKTLAQRSGMSESTINAKVAWLMSDKSHKIKQGQTIHDTDGEIFTSAIQIDRALGNGNQRTYAPRKSHLRVMIHRTRQALAKLAPERQ